MTARSCSLSLARALSLCINACSHLSTPFVIRAKLFWVSNNPRASPSVHTLLIFPHITKKQGIGGIEATQDVIDLCHKHDIKPAVEVVPVTDLNKVYTLLGKTNKTGLRYVIIGNNCPNSGSTTLSLLPSTSILCSLEGADGVLSRSNSAFTFTLFMLTCTNVDHVITFLTESSGTCLTLKAR